VASSVPERLRLALAGALVATLFASCAGMAVAADSLDSDRPRSWPAKATYAALPAAWGKSQLSYEYFLSLSNVPTEMVMYYGRNEVLRLRSLRLRAWGAALGRVPVTVQRCTPDMRCGRAVRSELQFRHLYPYRCGDEQQPYLAQYQQYRLVRMPGVSPGWLRAARSPC
jgi:hypothetical protein